MHYRHMQKKQDYVLSMFAPLYTLYTTNVPFSARDFPDLLCSPVFTPGFSISTEDTDMTL